MISPYVFPGLKGVHLPGASLSFQVEHLKCLLLSYSEKYQVHKATWADIESGNRKGELVLLRHMFCYICRRDNLIPTVERIGCEIGNKDHTTVIHAISTITARLQTEDKSTIDLYKFINANI